MKRRKAIAAFAGLCLVSVSTAASAEPVYVYDKVGVSAGQAASDLQGCTRRAKRISVAGSGIAATTIVGGLGAGLITGVMANMRRARQVESAERLCMIGQGYARLELTPEETQAYQKAGSRDARQAWLADFVAKDWSSRIADAQAAQPKLAPQLKDEPFALEGVRFDPAALKLTQGPVYEDQVLMTGVVTHRQTAVLNDDIEAKAPLVHVGMKAGAVLYGLDASGTTAAEQTTLWCGLAKATIFGGVHASAACLFSTETGDAMIPAGGGDWMISPELIPAALKPMPLTVGRIDLTPSSTDGIGPMGFTLKVVYVDGDQMRLRAVVDRGGKKVEIWSGVTPFDSAGRSVLPFWSKQLVMTRQYDKHRQSYAVQAVLTDDGTGGDWLDPTPTLPVVQAAATTTAKGQ